MRIKRLPPSIVKRIAAGEVVERPASVVKELIENALDAGATRISVKVVDGGIDLVEVSDNGCGMTEEEALLAVERHTTSKISSEEDLFSIETLGFRGEALYAISSVSMFELVTRTEGEDLATYLRLEGGLLKGIEKVVRDGVGTTVRVKNLFFNLRARRRFLRGKRIEQEHVRKVLKEYALSYPEVELRRRIEGVLGESPSCEGITDAAEIFCCAKCQGRVFSFCEQKGGVRQVPLVFGERLSEAKVFITGTSICGALFKGVS